jgi:hypothetical protein
MMFLSSEPFHRLQINISKSCKSSSSVAEVSIPEIGVAEVRESIWMQYSPSIPVSYTMLKQRNMVA